MQRWKILLIILFSNRLILWLLFLFLTLARMPSQLNIISWVLAVRFSPKYFLKTFSRCVYNTPMLTWNYSPAKGITERSLRWILDFILWFLTTYIMSHFLIFFWFYALHIIAIRQALTIWPYSTSKGPFTWTEMELWGVSVRSAFRFLLSYITLDKTRNRSVFSNAKGGPRGPHLGVTVSNLNDLIHVEASLP